MFRSSTTAPVHIRLLAPRELIAGKIVRFTRELTTATRTMLAEVDVENPDLKFSSGMTAEVTLVLRQDKDALLVPSNAVQERTAIRTYWSSKRTIPCKIKPLSWAFRGRKTEITQGLRLGDSVMVSAQSNYRVGELVRPQFSVASISAQGGNQ